MALESPTHASDLDRVMHNLTLHRPASPEVMIAMDQVRAGFKALAADVCHYVPAGRERSMALTATEDACMYAIAGLARAIEEPGPTPEEG